MRHRFRTLFSLFLFWLGSSYVFGGSEWRRLVHGSFAIHCHEEDVNSGEKVMSIAEDNLPRIMRDLGLPTAGNITIIIASSEKEFDVLTGGQIPDWGIGAADPLRATLFLKSPRFARPEANLGKIVIHEMCHVLVGMAVGGKKVPRWFDEGVALYESGERGIEGAILLARSLWAEEILWLDEIDGVLDFHRGKADLAYQESLSTVDYLVGKYGKDILARIVGALREGKGMDEAMLSTVGIGFQDFQMDWYQAMKKKYRWYVLLDFPLVFSTLAVVLFLSAFIVTLRRIRRKRRLWEEEAFHEIGTLEENSTSD